MLYKPQDKLLGETIYDASGSVTDVLDFTYDWNGQPFSVKYNGATYFYVLNLQGDVVRIVDGGGTSYGVYRYDAWGNILYSTNNTLMNINPLRYRGYYYDTETGFYYLQSRYYDPNICRFINADAYVSTGQGVVGCNMFAYCGNNSVMYVDPTGHSHSHLSNMCYEETLGFSDPSDEDVEEVYKSDYFSEYNGIPIVRHSSDILTSWAVGGVIFLNHNLDDFSTETKRRTLDHESGHVLQEQEYGTIKFMLMLGIPSMIFNVISRENELIYKNYYNLPWEYDADIRGDVERKHAEWAEALANMYFWVWGEER